jgi:hypothetical protein
MGSELQAEPSDSLKNDVMFRRGGRLRYGGEA